MIKIENVDVHGWKAAIRGARNPMNSWPKSDSGWCGEIECEECAQSHRCEHYNGDPYAASVGYVIGKNDSELLRNLSKAGDDHGKWERFVDVTCDITAPLYWWKEFDTYKVGTVANSCSTMHKIHAKAFELDDFSHEHLTDVSLDVLRYTIDNLNNCRELFLVDKDKTYWWQMIQLLPSSYNQKRTVQLNYQVLKHMYHARKQHKLDEWREFCKWIKTLPYIDLVIGE